MNEWGLPDWRDEKNYGNFSEWPMERWRWEFLRRRKDLRAAFDAHAENHYQLNLLINQQTGDETSLPKPNEPGFIVICPESEAFGYMGIPNPRISDQPLAALLLMPDAPQAIKYFSGADYSEDQFRRANTLDGPNKFAIIFDISKPLEDQLASARDLLKAEQKGRHRKHLQKRKHRQKWLTYLRTLDAREAGATWAEIAKILKANSATDQTARDTWEQARALCFNF